jgi:hypothetical protein
MPRRVFTGPEPELGPNLLPDTRIWVSFRGIYFVFFLKTEGLFSTQLETSGENVCFKARTLEYMDVPQSLQKCNFSAGTISVNV